jgi:hypothetical protein
MEPGAFSEVRQMVCRLVVGYATLEDPASFDAWVTFTHVDVQTAG